ncbi:LacI family DNA-binding transcriptional regulator [Jeotgalibacillus proteolyticus]|uniref:LacI family transcriptional regulator n=1 Tax=Jeotgalibacillus proteolyticus TaxID=2082395 RepID=A0A2S5GDP4_9BACL|nr:LacI family DNA-binding transcriptional regulator [Jeotgalibacillus proteolyticus]PPA71162.1 LacI family transcriptional regulator [Jeotgalibacillus proteolyticus]
MIKRYTIQDIAELAGVSAATVSKIMNNTGNISLATKERVKAIIEETGYSPTHSAKSLASKKTNLIGIVYAGKINVDLDHPFFNKVLNSFKSQIGLLGYDFIFFSNEQYKSNYLARCHHYNVDGVLIVAGDDIEEAIFQLDQSPIPCVGIDIELKGERSSYVMTDNYKVSHLVVEYAYMNSIDKIGIIGGTHDSRVSMLREEGFREAMKRFGLPVNKDWVVHGDYYEESGYRLMNEMIAKHKENLPELLFAFSDLMALGAIRALRENGLQAPDDIRVIGCDDIEACRYAQPKLTTIKQDKEKIGIFAAKLLSNLIDKKGKGRSLLVDPELEIRESCGLANDKE